ncbi:hypothetical protein [uncultured Paludibaculum sp.]|uniref:hypothetical protein n=1 Tax=uncultured Paludibaculum sp. TaxID=1765020 RepID=UPI002AAAA045|nr:hypothetical protein [uncultured Paludibaculum sp.]
MDNFNGMTADQLRAAIDAHSREQQPPRTELTNKDDARAGFLLTLPPNQLTKDDRDHLLRSVQDALLRWKEGTLE